VHNKAYKAGKKEGGEKKYDVPNITGSIMRQVNIAKATDKLTKEEVEVNENLENILVHAWNKDAVNLRDALDSEMQSRISDHVDSMVADVSARLFNPALSNENEG
jgi:peroxiredoxin